MRLINTATLELQSFYDDAVPPYAILSHRWTGAEISLQGFLAERAMPAGKQSDGTAKVIRFCHEMLQRGEQYAWVDTCCIDKTNSAELQEAINSMYKWYEDASICLVYMSDIEHSGNDPEPLNEQLEKSMWFTRGWTLQELVAPQNQVFVASDWTPLGAREDLSDILASITGIRPEYFGNAERIRSAPVAERMSWLSNRRTSRIEDLAYCMLGIFDLNLTMLYGEGHKAFARLQKEIINEIPDESIFVWSATDDLSGTPMSILAPHPRFFSVCRRQHIELDTYFQREPLSHSANGLKLELFGERFLQLSNELDVTLNCLYNEARVQLSIVRWEDAKRVGHKAWYRKAVVGIKTVNEGSYSVPLSAEDEFIMNGVPLASRLPSRGERSGRQAMLEYEQEKTRFTVFVR
jgi:hypothetical protein